MLANSSGPEMTMPRFAARTFAGMLVAIACGCGTKPVPNAGHTVAYSYPTGSSTDIAAMFKDNAPGMAQPSADLPGTLVNHAGKTVTLADYKGKKAVVLTVLRGIPQSPGGVACVYCVAQTNTYARNYPEFTRRDAEVLLLFPGPSDKVKEFLASSGGTPDLPFPVILDANLSVCDRLGIRGDLAKPSTYILDKAGRVVYAYVGETLSDRPSLKAVLAQLDKLGGRVPPATTR